MQINIDNLTKITMEGEIWKQIENYPYLISNMGRVYGIERNRIERGEWTYNGYHRVVLSRSGETKKFRVSHLVAAAFCKGYAEGKHIHHINRRRGDDRAVNLIPCTEAEHRLIHNLYDALGGNIELLMELLTPIIEPIRMTINLLYSDSEGGDVA